MTIQNSQPLVTVIIPIFNGSNFIVECLTSVVNQSYSNFEIIVVDDGSLDNSVEIIKRFMITHSNCRFKLFIQKNGGSSAARNTGLEHAEGLYVAFLDADDFWFPDKLEKQMSEMLTKELKVLGTFMRYGNKKSKVIGICGEDPSNRQAEIRLGKLMPVVLSSIIFEKKLLIHVSGFDEQLRYSQDLDLIVKCSHETEIQVIPKPLGVYRLHNSAISTVHGMIQEKNLQFIKYRYSEYPIRINKLSYLEFDKKNLISIDNEGKARVLFRNFGVLIINGEILAGMVNLIQSLCVSPMHVFRRLSLRGQKWISWKFLGN